MNSFIELKTQLQLTDAYENIEGLDRLKKWCLHHVSTDVIIEGNAQTQYQHYLEFVQAYFEVFLKYMPSDLSRPVAEFQGLNPVQYAAKYGYDRFLCEHVREADNLVNIPTDLGDTSLHLSAYSGHIHTVEVLLKLKADPTLPNKRHSLPIHFALFLPGIYEPYLYPLKSAIATMLLKIAPSTITAKNDTGLSVCHAMVLGDFVGLLENEIIQLNPNAALLYNSTGHFPIHTAILNGKLTAADRLLGIEKVATLADSEGQIALHYVTRYGVQELFDLCCQKTHSMMGHLDVRDSRKKTPLMLAVENGRLEMTKALISKGAKTDLVDDEEHTLVNLAEISNKPEIKAWLLEQSCVNAKQVSLR